MVTKGVNGEEKIKKQKLTVLNAKGKVEETKVHKIKHPLVYLLSVCLFYLLS